MRQILRVDMTSVTTRTEPLPDVWSRYGGRALTSAIVFTEVPANADPIGPNNKLVIAPGLLGGTTAPSTGRVSVGAKSPLTGGIKESNAGGMVGQTLGRLGVAAVVVEGLPEDDDARYLLEIDSEGGRLIRRDDLAGMMNHEVGDTLQAEYAGRRHAIMSNGPAGEMRLAAAGIACTDREGKQTRFAGRGGMGAVMGSKGIKAIVVIDEGLPFRGHADKDAFMAASKKMAGALREHAVTGEGLPTYGTNVLVNIINEAGGLPTRNFAAGQFEFADAISGEAMRELTHERGGNVGHACSTGCTIGCSRYFVDKDGHFKTKGPEYETAWSFGANCGIGDLDAIAELDRSCGDIGLDTIEMGATLGVYMDSGAIEFGDVQGALGALREIGEGTPLGRLLGSGTEITGRAFGVRRIPVVKGQAMPAYDPRPIQGIGVTYATSTMGADHTAGYAIATNILKVGGFVEPTGTQGQAELSKNLQIATAMLDSVGFCIFVAFAVLDIPAGFEAIHEMISAHTGMEWSGDDLLTLGKEVLTYERLFNDAAGFSTAEDRLPEFMYTEKLAPHDIVFAVSDEDLDSVYDFVPETAKNLGLQ